MYVYQNGTLNKVNVVEASNWTHIKCECRQCKK